MPIIKIFKNSWGKTLFLTVSAIYLYVLMEWIFFATKPSFMSTMNTGQDIKVFLLTIFSLGIPGIIAIFSIQAVSRLGGKKFETIGTWLGSTIPVLISTALAIILIDNFTYTVFGFGIVSTSGIWRSLYAILFVGLFIAFFRSAIKFIRSSTGTPQFLSYLVFFLLFASTLAFVSQIPNKQLADGSNLGNSSSDLPNIILLGSDGVDAGHMSVYGYIRDTTPNITELAQNALVAENAFSNSANTGGSLTSLLTGKLPTNTRVLYPPDILVGEDAYQHLPGILKQLGYNTIQISMPSFGDAYDRNIKNGFDVVNFRSENEFPLSATLDKLGGGSDLYFVNLIVQRITERIQHIFYIKEMENPYEMVTKPTSPITEEQRFSALISYLDEADKPFFIHIHMMGTHGPFFEPQTALFSGGESQDEPWMTDFYDDSIRDFDNYVRILFEHLTDTGNINNTVIVLYSDHGMNWKSLDRVPLIFWFPNNQFMGRIHENVQLIDVAPTILDYLRISPPAWMEGHSILANDLSPVRNIFSADVARGITVNVDGRGWIVDESKVYPPFYQVGQMNLIVCDQWFSLNLREPELTFGKVKGSTSVCNEAYIPSPEQAQDLILQRLNDDGYDTSSYPDRVPISSVMTKTLDNDVTVNGYCECAFITRL